MAKAQTKPKAPTGGAVTAKPSSKPGTAVTTNKGPQQVQKAKTREVATNDVFGGAIDAGQTTAEDFAIPFLYILQSGSPQVKKSAGEYVEGAEEGNIYNTVSKELYENVMVLAAHYERVFIEWVPREKGGGFVARYKEEPEYEVNEKGDWVLPNGNHLKDTRQWYVLVINPDGSSEPATIGMSGSNIKTSKRMMTTYRLQHTKKPFILNTVPRENEKGSWFAWDFSVGEFPEGAEELAGLFRDFQESCKSGNVRTADETLRDDASTDAAPGDNKNW